jgi:hypothetical protein
MSLLARHRRVHGTATALTTAMMWDGLKASTVMHVERRAADTWAMEETLLILRDCRLQTLVSARLAASQWWWTRLCRE